MRLVAGVSGTNMPRPRKADQALGQLVARAEKAVAYRHFTRTARQKAIERLVLNPKLLEEAEARNAARGRSVAKLKPTTAPRHERAKQRPKEPTKQAAQSASAAPGLVVCPDCGKTFKTQGALGGHRAYLHRIAPRNDAPASRQIVRAKSSAGGLTAGAAAATSQPPPALSHPGFSTSSLNSAHEHLREAREALVGRHQQIEDELNRLTGLQAEKERVQRELDAVNSALQVFGDNN